MAAIEVPAQPVDATGRRSPSGEGNEIVRTNPLQNEEHG
jgi:hypothetical protein